MSESKKRKVLLVGWDAADWEHITPLLDKGQLPTLSSLVNAGSMGNLATLQPVLSPMLWNSIATGKHPYKHGIHGFVEPDPVHGGARPYSSVSRKCKALWNILSQQGYRCNVINWWASHPAEPVNGCIVSNLFAGVQFEPGKGWQIATGVVHPAHKAKALAPNKVFSHELTAEQLLPFVPNAHKIDQDSDERLSVLCNVVSETLTTHSVATAVMEKEPWDFMAVYYTAIDHFSHAFMPFHPPRMPWIPEADFEMYKDVISGIYRFSDMALRRLLDLAGPDVTVILCSDHGFQSRESRPMLVPNEPAGPAFWHRQYGVFLAKGPGIKQDERVYGASLVDITPTILTLLGLPVGDDMDGRVLTEIFSDPPVIQRIPSWDDVPGNSGMHTGEVVSERAEADALLEQFVALGYIEPQSENREEQSIKADIECKYNLCRNLASCGRHEEAIRILLDLVHRSPWENRFILQLARSFLSAGYVKMAERTLTSAFEIKIRRHPAVRVIWADILIAQHRTSEAVEVLGDMEALANPSGELLKNLGHCYLKLRRWADAERVYLRAIAVHHDNVEAWQGLSTLYCRLGRNQDACNAALKAVSMIYRLPRAHLNLGTALVRSGDAENGIVALNRALQFNPNIRAAHRLLHHVYESILPNPELAAHHQKELLRAWMALEPSIRKRRSTSDVIFDLPAFPPEELRGKTIDENRPGQQSQSQKSGKCFTLVSGLPRSGTSLMMQMLEAGGLAPKTDSQRVADRDNPQGYYEWEAVKQVGRKPQIMDEDGLDKKAIKAISMLLQQMPYKHEYKIIFMTRPVEEVVKSQLKMIERLETKGAKLTEEELRRILVEHRDSAIEWLGGHPRAKFIEVDYTELIRSPEEPIRRIADFLGSELLPHPERMQSAIQQSLYRNRAS